MQEQVMRSIRDNITEEILLNEINEVIRLPLYADRIRIDSMTQECLYFQWKTLKNLAFVKAWVVLALLGVIFSLFGGIPKLLNFLKLGF